MDFKEYSIGEFDTEEQKKVPAGSAGMDRQKYGPASCDIVGRARVAA